MLVGVVAGSEDTVAGLFSCFIGSLFIIRVTGFHSSHNFFGLVSPLTVISLSSGVFLLLSRAP